MRRPCFVGIIMVANGLAAAGWAQEPTPTSVRLGMPGTVSYGAATFLRGDKLFGSGVGSTLPGWLRWALAPRLDVGDAAATAGLAAQGLGQGYRGLTWSVPLASGVLHQDDALSFGFTLGRSVADLVPGGDGRERGLLRTTPYLRLGAGLAYQVTPRLGLYVLFDHVSGGGPPHVDESLNDLGMRVSLRF